MLLSDFSFFSVEVKFYCYLLFQTGMGWAICIPTFEEEQ